MLPKINRLTKKNDFDVVFKQGKTIKGEFLISKWLKSHLPESRFGFVVSKKISSKATVRNKVKRRLRDAVAKESQHFQKPYDVVVVALQGIEKREFKEVLEAVHTLFKKQYV